MVSEMIHTASLVHDDVIDESDIRRGKPTANARWGNRQVLSSDLKIILFTFLLGCSCWRFYSSQSDESLMYNRPSGGYFYNGGNSRRFSQGRSDAAYVSRFAFKVLFLLISGYEEPRPKLKNFCMTQLSQLDIPTEF